MNLYGEEMLNEQIVLEDNFIFDYSTMLGKGRIQENDFAEISNRIAAAVQSIATMRATGYVRGHLSKDGVPEPVYFTRLPYLEEGNPNDRASLAALQQLTVYAREKVDVVVFLGVGGSYLGNKVLFDIFCGEGWNNLSREERRDCPYVFFAGNNMDPRQCMQFMKQISNIATSVLINTFLLQAS